MNTGTGNIERDALIAKLQKLRKFTTANGCTEAEAMAAAAKVAQLIAEHNVNDTEMSLKLEANGCLKDVWSEIGRGYSSLSGMTRAIGELFEVKPWVERHTSDALGLGFDIETIDVVFFGYPADVAGAMAMAEIITMAVQTELTRFVSETKRPRQDKRERADLDNSFRAGMGARISERLRSLIPAKVTGTGLMVIKNQLVVQELNKLGYKFGKARTVRGTNSAAYAAGKVAGGRVDLGHGHRVGGTLALPGSK